LARFVRDLNSTNPGFHLARFVRDLNPTNAGVRCPTCR
jgi:hypothetical protein